MSGNPLQRHWLDRALVGGRRHTGLRSQLTQEFARKTRTPLFSLFSRPDAPSWARRCPLPVREPRRTRLDQGHIELRIRAFLGDQRNRLRNVEEMIVRPEARLNSIQRLSVAQQNAMLALR